MYLKHQTLDLITQNNNAEGGTKMDKYSKYLLITSWAAKRYRRGGLLILSVGNDLSIYSRIERAAWNKYLA